MAVRKLRSSLMLWRAALSSDGMGGTVKDWRAIGSIWGAITPDEGDRATGLLTAPPAHSALYPQTGDRLHSSQNAWLVLEVRRHPKQTRRLECSLRIAPPLGAGA